MPTKKKPPTNHVDIDALIKDDLEANLKKATTATIDLGGRTWTLTDAGSVMAAVELFSGDEDKAGSAYTDWMLGMVVEDERDDFDRLLRRIQGLDATLLMKIGNAMSEALTGRPTEQSPDSPASSGGQPSDTPSTESFTSPDGLDSNTSEELTL
ncbi:MAG TPA: hypothetical protein VNC22_23105 [Sporichthya sp.]|nr:hypothetical protein [Sporichthya sp.]